MEVIKKVESREDYKKWLLDTHGIFCIKGFSEEPNTSFMPNTAKLALIQEWLRDEKNIVVIADIDRCKRAWFFCSMRINSYFESIYQKFDNHNEALSKGIEESLKLID